MVSSQRLREALGNCQSVGSIMDTANEWFADVGATAVMFHNFRGNQPLYSDFPSAVDAIYFGEIGIKRDPALKRAIQSGNPVRIGSLFKSSEPASPESRLMRAAYDAGIREAAGFFIVPRHGSFKYAVLGFSNSSASHSNPKIDATRQIVEVTAQRLADIRLNAASASLSAREIEVLRLASTGRSDKEIARDLGIAPSTVRTLIERSANKLAVETRIEAVIEALRRGLICPN